MNIKHKNLPPVDVFPKTPQLKYLKLQPIGTIEIGYKFDEFKIKLEILILEERFDNAKCSRVKIENKLRELEKEFNEFIKTIHSPTVLNVKEKELCLS